jgi:pSer/pThr/pTyr-binding forkhead associated (FHA) protein
MGVRLTVKMKGAAGGEKARTVMLDDDNILLGRDQSCQVQLAQMAVSRNHARIFQDGELYFVEDLGSSYGTLLNGEKLDKGEKQVLKNGDTLAIAQFDVTFDRIADVHEDNSGKTSFISRDMVRGVMGGLGPGGQNAYFRLMNGRNEGQKIELSEGQEYVFGRDGSDADIVLNDDLVSRRHAKVRRDWSGTHVEDLKSRNGIKVNKKRTARATLKDRDEVEIGGVRLLFVDPSEVREEPVVLSQELEAEGESTQSVQEDPRPDPEPEPEPEPDPPAEDPPPEDPAPEEPPAEDNPANTAEDPPADELPADDPPPDDQPPEDEGPRKLIDFSNKQTLLALGLGGLLLLVGITILVALLVL